MPTITGKVESMRRDKKGVKVNGEWYSSFNAISGVEWKDEVEFEFEQKGRYNNIKGAVRKLGSGGGGSNSGKYSGSGNRSTGYSNVGVEVGHASNLAMRMMEQRIQMEDNIEIGSTDYYKMFMEDTKNVHKIMTALRASIEKGDEPAPKSEVQTEDLETDDIF